MINLHIAFLFRELNEIVKTIESRSNNAISENDIDLIENLKHIKNKVKSERWIEKWNEEELLSKMSGREKLEWLFSIKDSDERAELDELSIRGQMLISSTIVEKMVDNDCYVATKVSRALLSLVGKAFQGTAKLIIASISLAYEILLIYYLNNFIFNPNMAFNCSKL